MKISIIGGGPGGLYTAVLLKKQWPTHDITVYERNRPDDTFGFGVVFSDETLGIFKEYDEPSYEAIRRNFAYWDDVEIHFKGQSFRCAGNGFAGCSRQSLLRLLQERCGELGVELCFQYEFEPEMLAQEPFASSDLIIAADGINSRIREAHKGVFGTAVDLRQDYFCWLGSTRDLDAFEYFFRETPHGPIIAHCYQYQPGMSTWVIEIPPRTYLGYGFDKLNAEAGEHIPILADIFATELDGHPLINNRSLWRQFPTITNQTWVMGNVVLLGDAKATAHYSIGSGTKLAMEDAISLLECLRQTGTVAEALHRYDTDRREEVGKTQHTADVSLRWFEALERHWHLDPPQFAFGVMSRAKSMTYEELLVRDETFVKPVQRWFVNQVRRQGFDVAEGTPPMFTPFRLREMIVPNRVVVSPMAQYTAVDGLPNEWHLVHLGSRAIGGAGLLFVEMTCPAPDARITPGCTGLWNDEQCAQFRRIVEFVHTHSQAKICMQLGHAGRKGSTQFLWQNEDRPLPNPEDNWPLVSASPLPYYPGESQTPRELTRTDMTRIIADFVRATHYAEEAGFDMLEIHMAHGYLLASFISPLTNRRTDEYGGPIENRLRFPLELFAACRAIWPAHKPMSVRISASDWTPGGLTEAELTTLAWLFKKAGVDLMDVSSGQTVPEQQPVYGRMYQTPFADQIRHEVGIATMAVGAITTPDQVNTILLQGRADLVALARPHLSNPYFTLQAAAHYNYRPQHWPDQYLSGRRQAYREAEKARAEWLENRRLLKPPSHKPGS
ncbi:MAG: bifunctional salicylyl-CoA 5-hydroxylase/oxidoreductase [Chloroflexi bacterium]|nr:FAD-dependent monooxygenase [Ardenticatenaceae bacterium]MBL1130808.1 bifunctional salicylyl-CoA 5-hydroxylase/oxidoreductase [Chloroflexota bacterium]NOG36904.1 bifunctional salicylyl-CoA 5-hydroxylase/oxidoreductase [Chloroflexota bacterium]GIK58391.1 MAG: bifunctional hydroxylase/oxidoreductase [Chloroflexota bacterium]